MNAKKLQMILLAANFLMVIGFLVFFKLCKYELTFRFFPNIVKGSDHSDDLLRRRRGFQGMDGHRQHLRRQALGPKVERTGTDL